jgi:hypothetical protein
MSTLWLPLTAAFVAVWARVYTAGAPALLRDGRRAEIASDLWEHQAEARACGLLPGPAAREIIDRWWRGVPADVAWRLNVGGNDAMLSRAVVERAAGALLILVVGLIVYASASSRVGIGADEPYFTYDFPDFARNLAPFGRGLIVMGLAAIALIAAAAGFWAAFQRLEPLMAAVGGFFFTTAGIVLLVAVGAGRAVYALADQWRVGGTYYDATWQAARAAALLFEFLMFATFAMLLVGLLGVGLMSLRRSALPRWLGALATTSGACVALAFAVGAAGQDAYNVLMSGVLIGMVWFIATGVWLLVRGTTGRDLAPASPVG